MFKRFSAGFAAGYVFGARAGERRYKQITDLVDRALEIPVLSDLADRASEVVNADHGRDLIETVRDRVAAAWPRGNHDRAELEDEPDDEEDEEDQEDDRGGRNQSDDAGDDEDEYDDRDEIDESDDEDEDEDEDEQDEGADEEEDDDTTAARRPPRQHRGRPDSRQRSRGGGSPRPSRRPRRGIRALAGAAIERGRLT